MKSLLSILASLLILLFAINLQSCRKDNVEDLFGPPPCDTTFIQNYSFDTVYPSDYIMAYPGSWWVYDDGQIDSCFNWATVSVVNNTYAGNCVTVHEDKKILPRTTFGFISFESKVSTIGYNPTSVSQLLATNPGVFLHIITEVPSSPNNQDAHKITQTREVIEHLDSMEINGVVYYDIIHVYDYVKTFYYHISNGPYWTHDYYYARNIGLIRKYITYVGTPYHECTLSSYYIAPH